MKNEKNIKIIYNISIHTICLGGTRQIGNSSLEIVDQDREAILQRCKELCPSLEASVIVIV